MALRFNSNKDDEPSKKVIGKLRRAQLVTTFGCGATTDMVDYSIILAGADYWAKFSPKLHEPTLERMLQVNHFKEPLVSETQDTKGKPDIPAFRFPYQHFCPKCGTLKPYWKFDDENYCNNNHSKTKIIPSRFMVACVNGHLEDFPFDWWVHNGIFKDCKTENRQGILKINFSDETGGLDHIVIKCTACGKVRTMAGCMHPDALSHYHCRGKRPWLSSPDTENCTAKLRTVQRGASNVYFPVTASALTIPPWSNKIHQEIINNFDKIEGFLDNPKKLKTAIELHFEDLLENYPLENLINEILKLNQISTSHYSKKDLLEDEYKVFCTGDYDKSDDKQFKIQRASVPKFLEDLIDEIVLAKRLREILVLRGFRRLIPEVPNVEDIRFSGYHIQGDCVPLSEDKLNWLPAIEMLGEGIFIKINEKKLNEWEDKNQHLYAQMYSRLQKSHFEIDNFSARYVLLHTLSHLLIRQISFESGYSNAALKERIYSTYPNSTAMSGILIYTSSSDSDGSLGGLVRNAQPESFGKIFKNMLNEAAWCASDPICIQSMAQGYNSLNYAACHACTLLPETSCEMRNCLLDRTAVVGNLVDRYLGLFGELL